MRKIVKSFAFAVAVKVSSIIKISCAVGSHILWLSGPAIIAPLVGAFAGVTGSIIVLLARMIFHCAVFKTISMSFLAFCIPGFVASLYWATNSSLIRLFVPLLCMGLFVVHSVGGQAFIYSLYWLIPVVIFFIPRKTVFLQALGSTFVAHAVGSVIWLYTVPMTAAMWLNLMPIVAVERLIFALGMVIVYKIIMMFRPFVVGIIGSCPFQKNYIFTFSPFVLSLSKD